MKSVSEIDEDLTVSRSFVYWSKTNSFIGLCNETGNASCESSLRKWIVGTLTTVPVAFAKYVGFMQECKACDFFFFYFILFW